MKSDRMHPYPGCRYPGYNRLVLFVVIIVVLCGRYSFNFDLDLDLKESELIFACARHVPIYLIFLYAVTWENCRFQFLAEGDPDMNAEVAYAVMVENIPEDKRSSPALYGYFDHLFPGKVGDADHLDQIVWSNRSLAPIT